MARRNIPLNAAQVEVLTWVRDGCREGVYKDWSHRIIARALHNRGLVAITGRGIGWNASLTEDGVHYLEHGSYPLLDDPPKTLPPTVSAILVARGPREAAVSPPTKKPRTRHEAPKKPGQIEQFISTLAATGRLGIWLGSLRGGKAVPAKIPEGQFGQAHP